ncbi:hypothetical protein EI94DRAFT_1708141 [Lactarius quietus]|nr:hypothetical protein EI94DRAFT_1708141 [Lactarius quietus]
MASKLMQVELQFLAIAAKLFAAAMIFLAHPADDGQQIYLDRKVKDEITSLETQFNAFMGDPMKVRKKPHIYPIIQIMVQEWKAAEAEQRMPNWGIFTFDYISEHCNAQAFQMTGIGGSPAFQLPRVIQKLSKTLQHQSLLHSPNHLLRLACQHHVQCLAEVPSHIWGEIGGLWTFFHANCTDILIAFPLYLMPPKAASELTQVETQFLAIAARLFTAAMTFSAQPPDDGQQAYLVRKVKDEIISVGNQFKKFMGDPSKHTKKPRMHPIIQIIRYLQGLQNHRRWWVTGLPPPHGDVDVAMEVMAAPAQPSAPISAAAPTMPDAPATSKAKAHTLPPAGSSDPYGAPPASTTRRAPYAFRRPRRQPGAEPMQGTFSTTPSDDFEDCTLSDMIADMDSTPSAQGRASDMSLPRVQVDDASPPPPAQRRRLDIQPLVATGDYRCGTCKNPKVNNAQCVSQLNENRLTYKCAFCAEKRRLCAPVASWAQPIIRLMKFRNIDVPPDVEASYGPSAVGTSSISPGENLESRVNSLEAKMDYVILVLNALAGIQGIVPSDLPGYTQPPAPRRSASPSHHSLSSLELPLHP